MCVVILPWLTPTFLFQAPYTHRCAEMNGIEVLPEEKPPRVKGGASKNAKTQDTRNTRILAELIKTNAALISASNGNDEQKAHAAAARHEGILKAEEACLKEVWKEEDVVVFDYRYLFLVLLHTVKHLAVIWRGEEGHPVLKKGTLLVRKMESCMNHWTQGI